jgi:hypothetical protein
MLFPVLRQAIAMHAGPILRQAKALRAGIQLIKGLPPV